MATLISSTLNPTSPLLVPDILHEVFRYLTPLEHLVPPAIPFDLFHSSLVCRCWHQEARPLLENIIDGTFRSLFYGYSCTEDESEQIANLLVESFHNGVSYPANLIERMTINISRHLLHSDSNVNPFEKILKLPLPKLNELLLNIDNIPVLRLQRMNDIITRIHPYCSTLTRLTIVGEGGGAKYHRGIQMLIDTVSPRIKSLKLFRYVLCHRTIVALRRCTALQEVEFHDIYHERDGETPVLSWPSLRRFHYSLAGKLKCSHLNKIFMNKTIAALAGCCPLLESLVFVTLGNSEWMLNIDRAYILLGRCRKLRQLCLAGDNSVDDNLLNFVLFRQGWLLEHIDLEGSTKLTGEGVQVWDGGWPKLRSLRLAGCTALRQSFVEKVVIAYPKIHEIVLPEHLDSGVRDFMKRNGFCRRANTWLKMEGWQPDVAMAVDNHVNCLQPTQQLPWFRRRISLRQLRQ
ncbi:hypothetical protein BC936DRAFT_142548 [Jimgerdemannia flammicorona]|uniref:F-box domain-containing protein n=1 Tax=Jimgerdemannia flammicorona TaxID=994334 RepID=A0A433A068_9FUNG|nr:hypothetical protein BC936DRAFT_142548 [Jimgerdemannia flammicorona]